MDILIGSHVSFKKDEQLIGSVKEALSYNANAFMIYTGAPQNTNRSNIDDNLTQQAYQLMNENKIDYRNIIVHAPYIINLANKINHKFSIKFLKQEIDRVKQLGLTKLVFHPGSHVGVGEEVGLKNIIEALNQVNEQEIELLIETMAGKGSELGVNFNQIKYIIDNIKHNQNIKVCLDTCHLNDSGYNINDIDTVLKEFDQIIGIDKIGCVHINDSKNNIGESKDRHENFGLGTIGFESLLKVIYHEQLKNVPKILETPYIDDIEKNIPRIYSPYKFEIEMIKSRKMNPNLLKDIIKYYK